MNARPSLMNAWGDLADIPLYKEAKGDQGFSVFIDQAFGMLGARRGNNRALSGFSYT